MALVHAALSEFSFNSFSSIVSVKFSVVRLVSVQNSSQFSVLRLVSVLQMDQVWSYQFAANTRGKISYDL